MERRWLEGREEVMKIKAANSLFCFYHQTLGTCGLCPGQRRADLAVVRGEDLHGVLGAGLESMDDSGLGISSGSRKQLPLPLLWTGIQDPVGSDDSLRTVPGDPQRGGVHV